MKKMLLVLPLILSASVFNLSAKNHDGFHENKHSLFKELKLTKEQRHKLKELKRESKPNRKKELKELENRLNLTPTQKEEFEKYKKEKMKSKHKQMKKMLKQLDLTEEQKEILKKKKKEHHHR